MYEESKTRIRSLKCHQIVREKKKKQMTVGAQVFYFCPSDPESKSVGYSAETANRTV